MPRAHPFQCALSVSRGREVGRDEWPNANLFHIISFHIFFPPFLSLVPFLLLFSLIYFFFFLLLFPTGSGVVLPPFSQPQRVSHLIWRMGWPVLGGNFAKHKNGVVKDIRDIRHTVA